MSSTVKIKYLIISLWVRGSKMVKRSNQLIQRIKTANKHKYNLFRVFQKMFRCVNYLILKDFLD